MNQERRGPELSDSVRVVLSYCASPATAQQKLHRIQGLVEHTEVSVLEYSVLLHTLVTFTTFSSDVNAQVIQHEVDTYGNDADRDTLRAAHEKEDMLSHLAYICQLTGVRARDTVSPEYFAELLRKGQQDG